MAITRTGNSLAVAACFGSLVAAQDQAETCYGPGSVVGAVVGTLIVTLGLLLSGFFLYKIYWKNRKGKHLVLIADSENPHDQYAFDNPCFREATPIKHSIQGEKQNSKLEKTKWPGWPPVHTFGKERKTEKVTSMDDSCLNDARLKVVNLRSHDFTGLGFNICGNMRDGIFVKDVLHRGPAFESGCINTGDRIDSVCISFRNMVFEDALTILSYASPYDVQVQVENDSCSRPSTLMRSKRDSNALKNSSDRILHPKFSRSQSFSHANEMDKGSNKKMTHQTAFLQEKNRMNHSMDKSQDFTDYPTIKLSSQERDGKAHKNVIPKGSPLHREEKSPKVASRDKEQFAKSADPQNKLQKFGIKVLPVGLKSGVQPETPAKRPVKSQTVVENEIADEMGPRSISPEGEKASRFDEQDTGRENVKKVLSKGFLNLKEKISQNSIGRKRKEDEGGLEEDGGKNCLPEGNKQDRESDCPVPKLRSSVTGGVKAHEQNHRSHTNVPEEVSRAGDVARNNRKSTAEARKALFRSPESEEVDRTIKTERSSDSEGSSDRESTKDDPKRPKKSKGKAPAPPKQTTSSKEMNEIKRESELPKEGVAMFNLHSDTKQLENEADTKPSYESDSDAEPTAVAKEGPNTKIELNATQVTVHQSPAGDANDDDVEPNRKAASLGDLSRLDSEQPLSIVLERAVSLDLTDGTSQCGKKRKAPLPPSEEFPPAFDDLTYRKEPRLEGPNTFQRRLKKSSDFGTLEDALCEGPKSLEIEMNRHSPLDLAETHNYNIQEFSSWLAECRKQRTTEENEPKSEREEPKINSTSLININSSGCVDKEVEAKDTHEYQGGGNVSFSVNGRNIADFEVGSSPPDNGNFSGTNSRTVVVISQPSSLEPTALEKVLVGDGPKEAANGTSDRPEKLEDDPTPPKLPTSPMPTSNTLSSPLSSTLTYITEIKVSTSDRGKSVPEIPSPNFVSERIQKFDSPKGFDPSPAKNNFGESSKIPVRTMKSETGQKVLATIQSLAKEGISSPTKSHEAEYTRRVASLFSNSSPGQGTIRNDDESEMSRPNISGLYLKAPPPKPSKDYSPTRKVPPVVPPRKMETALTSKSTVTVELPSPGGESQERNVVTFSSFAGKNRGEDPGPTPRTSFKIEERGELNGREEDATKIVLERNDDGGL